MTNVVTYENQIDAELLLQAAMCQLAIITRTMRIIVMMVAKIFVMVMMVVLMIMKMKSCPEAALWMYFQVGVATAHRRALLPAGPQPGDAPAAVGVSSWLRYPGAARAALLLLRPAQRHQRHGSGQVGKAGLRPGGLGLGG